MSGKTDMDRAYALVHPTKGDRRELAEIIAALLAEIRRLKRGKR